MIFGVIIVELFGCEMYDFDLVVVLVWYFFDC